MGVRNLVQVFWEVGELISTPEYCIICVIQVIWVQHKGWPM